MGNVEKLQIRIDDSSKEAKEKSIRELQKAFDDLVLACEEQSKLLKRQDKDLGDSFSLAKSLMSSAENMRKSLVNINIVLQSKRELWEKDEEMQELLNSISKIILSSSSIKGAVSAKQ